MAKRSDMDHGLLLLIVAILAWIIPGAGHFFIKERKRAVIIFVTITATFTTGLYIGSIAVIDPVGAWPWYIGQMITTPGVAVIAKVSQNETRKWELAKRASTQAAHETAQAEHKAINAAENAKKLKTQDAIQEAELLNQEAKLAKQKSDQLLQEEKQVMFASYGRPHDFGQIYTAIAGAMNLLAILSAVYMAHSGRGEMIGSEEDE